MGAKNIPDRHHHVPQMILRNFTNEEGLLWGFNKKGQKAFQNTPQNIFVKRGLYEEQDTRGEKIAPVEAKLAQLEGLADPIVKKIVSATGHNRCPNLASDEREYLCHFALSLARRTPHMRKMVEQIAPDMIRRLVEEYQSLHRPLSHEIRAKYDDQDWQRPRIQKAWAQTNDPFNPALDNGEILSILRTMGLCVVKIENPKKSFVIGSNPCMKITPPGHAHLGDPKVELLIPMASDVLISMSRGFPYGQESFYRLNDTERIREINKAMAGQSLAIAGRSRELVESLGRRIGAALT